MTAPRTLVEKIWADHEIRDFGNGYSLLHVDRNVMHDLLGALVFEPLDRMGRTLPFPKQHLISMDHGVDTDPGRGDETKNPGGKEGVQGLRRKGKEYGITNYDIGDVRQGIVHVVAPEQGFVLPGQTLVCGDSHTTTIGGMGALAWGLGLTEIEHVLATQTVTVEKPKHMRIWFDGTVNPGVTPKDMILHTIGKIGAKAGNGYAVEYAGPAIRAMPVQGRLTICNMAIEMAVRFGIIQGDDVTFDYLQGKPFAPKGRLWDEAVAYWRTLDSDDGARWDREVRIDCSAIAPSITWGTSPQDVVPVDGLVPDPVRAETPDRRAYIERALKYSGLEGGKPIAGNKIDVAFIGSCTNARLSDLRRAAAILKGKRKAAHVTAWVVPGSGLVKRDAEAEGLDRIFKDAGFEWREPGCSMCVALGGDKFPPGARSISSTNRNFENRQGPGVRTHLASPEMVAAAAIAGAITDVRKVL